VRGQAEIDAEPKGQPACCGLKRAELGGYLTCLPGYLDRPRHNCQYLSTREREKLIRDYIWARDSYRKAVVDARRAYDELVKRGLIAEDDKKSEP
jgi:hypothetical protein